MATIKIVQNSFTQGELGDYLDAREDLPLYKAGAKKIENWLVLPQGGLLRRPGFEFLDDHPSSSASSTSDDLGFNAGSRLITFSFSTEQEYCLVLEPSLDQSVNSKFHVYRNGFHAATVQDSDNYWYDLDTLNEIKFAQTFDTMILVHPSYPPKKIARSSHTSWTIDEIQHGFLPMANFDTGCSFSSISANTGSITWTASTSAHGLEVNHYVRMNAGLIKVTSVSGTSLGGDVEEDLAGTDDVSSTGWDQTAFSNDKGYPRSVTFHQNRLIYGGTQDKPQTIFGSQTGDFFNFKPTVSGSVTDDSAFNFTIGSDQVNTIKHIVSKQTLFIFTASGEFEMTGNPVSPTNVNIRLQTRYGIASGAVTPTSVDNEILFITNNNREMRGFVFDFNSDSYYAKNYTIVAHDVLNEPKDMTGLRAYKNTNQNYIFVVNSNGEMGVLSINVEKAVTGWSRFTTSGNFKRVATVFDKQMQTDGVTPDTTKPEVQRLYVLCERTYKKNDGTTTSALFLERLTEEEIYLDSYLQANSASHTSLQNLMHLSGQSVGVIADGSLHSNQTVTARTANPNAAITLTGTSSNTQVGHYYTSTATTMTLPVQINEASQRGEQIQKVSVLINLNNTKAMKVDGNAISFTSTSTTLGSGISPFTGTKKINIGGIATDPNVIVSVDTPLPATLLGLTTKVSVTTE
jgi:hypothetical protein